MLSMRFVARVLFIGGCLLLLATACIPAAETTIAPTRLLSPTRTGLTSAPAATTATTPPATKTEATTAATAETRAAATATPTKAQTTPTPFGPPNSASMIDPSELSPQSTAKTKWINATSPVTIYSGPGTEFEPAGAMAVGLATRVLGDVQNDWIPIECPDTTHDSCWVAWDYNALYPYEGAPQTLNIPDPASLAIESTYEIISPDGQWHVQMTRSETVLFTEESASFFYIDFTVSSPEDDLTWTLASEWHAAGLGEEGPPSIFHWSADGDYVYYTNTFDYHGVKCELYVNVGDILDRLDLRDGTVAALPPPSIWGILAISPDEQWMAYNNADELVIRNMAAAYDAGIESQDPVTWRIPLDLVGPDPVSNVAWSPDSKTALFTTTKLAEDCALISRSTWELDVESGALIPAPTPSE